MQLPAGARGQMGDAMDLEPTRFATFLRVSVAAKTLFHVETVSLFSTLSSSLIQLSHQQNNELSN